MNHTVLKQKWCKTMPSGKVEEVYTIHLSLETLQKFIEQNRLQLTYPGYVATDRPKFDQVNDEIYRYLVGANGTWIEEYSGV